MRFELNIDYSPEKMELSRQRLEARTNFTYIDRVPVGFCLVPRYFTPKFNIPYSEIFKDVETQYYWLLQAERHFRGIDPRPHGGFGMAEDSAQIMSADMFREFVVPYDNRLYDE